MDSDLQSLDRFANRNSELVLWSLMERFFLRFNGRNARKLSHILHRNLGSIPSQTLFGQSATCSPPRGSVLFMNPWSMLYLPHALIRDARLAAAPICPV